MSDPFMCAVYAVQTPVISDERKALQKSVDSSILKGLDATLKKYLGAKFSLTNGQAPHAMKF